MKQQSVPIDIPIACVKFGCPLLQENESELIEMSVLYHGHQQRKFIKL